LEEKMGPDWNGGRLFQHTDWRTRGGR
jgi:hypothetical protein